MKEFDMALAEFFPWLKEYQNEIACDFVLHHQLQQSDSQPATAQSAAQRSLLYQQYRCSRGRKQKRRADVKIRTLRLPCTLCFDPSLTRCAHCAAGPRDSLFCSKRQCHAGGSTTGSRQEISRSQYDGAR